MWKSFVLELHGEWSEFADECIALLSSTKKCFRVARYSASPPPKWPKNTLGEGSDIISKLTRSVTQDSAKPMFEIVSCRNHRGAFSKDLPALAFKQIEGFLVIFPSQLNGKEGT